MLCICDIQFDDETKLVYISKTKFQEGIYSNRCLDIYRFLTTINLAGPYLPLSLSFPNIHFVKKLSAHKLRRLGQFSGPNDVV